MTKATLCYSPYPSQHYGAGRSLFFAIDDDAWNLAWLSHDMERGSAPTPVFSSLVRRSLQFVVATGQLDLIDAVSPDLKVRGYLRLPAAQAVMKIMQMELLTDIPMFCKFGTKWTDTMLARSKLYKDPYDKRFDMDTTPSSETVAAIAAIAAKRN